MLNWSHYFPITDPTLIFFVVLCIILLAPIVMSRLRIPHIIGMVLAGIVVGQYGLNILERDSSFELFGKVGLLYIMFLAGLEMNLTDIMKRRGKFLSASTRRNSCPTAPLAPTIATFISFSILCYTCLFVAKNSFSGAKLQLLDELTINF